VDAMSERASSASQYALSLENQDGVSLRMTPEDRKLIAMGMTLHESGKQLMSRVRARLPSSPTDAASVSVPWSHLPLESLALVHGTTDCATHAIHRAPSICLASIAAIIPCLGQMGASPARPGAGRGVLRSL
jgi:hypothetical protein